MLAPLNVGGNRVVNMAAGISGSDGATYGQLLGLLPIGVVVDWAASGPPTNWLICDGSAISRTTYATLFALIGTTYGVGDGSTTFNVPDCRGRVVAAYDPTGTILTSATMTPDGMTLGATGGAQLHTLTTPQIPSHTHTATSVVTDPGHVHQYLQPVTATAGAGASNPAGGSTSANTGSSTTGITVATTNTSTGGGGAHLNMQPTILMQKIIRVL